MTSIICENSVCALLLSVDFLAPLPPTLNSTASSYFSGSSLCLTASVVSSSAGRWNTTDMAVAGRISTTPRWTRAVSVRRLTLPRGWSPLPLTRWPSRPRAAPHNCGGPTRTHTWRRSRCLDARERSASRFDASVDAPRPDPLHPVLTSLNRHKTEAFSHNIYRKRKLT